MRGAKPLALLTAFLVELGYILHGFALLSVAEGEPPVPQPVALHAATPGLAPVRTAAMLARPLFTPGRAPFRGVHAPAPEPAALPRLTGLIVAERRGRAIFAGPDGKPVVLGEGGRLGPFTVVAVRPDGVDLSGPPGLRTFRPSSDAALRSQAVYKPAVLALIDPDRRELETENDQ